MKVFAILAALCLGSGAADCGSGLGSCDDETSLLQTKEKIHAGTQRPYKHTVHGALMSQADKQELEEFAERAERPYADNVHGELMSQADKEKLNKFAEGIAKSKIQTQRPFREELKEVDSLQKSAYEKEEMRQLVGNTRADTEVPRHEVFSHEELRPKKSQKSESFVGTVNGRKWMFWFKKGHPPSRSEATQKTKMPNLKDIAKGGDASNLYALTSSSDSKGASIQQWGWRHWDDWGPYGDAPLDGLDGPYEHGPYGHGFYGHGPYDDGCPDLGLGLPGCSWAGQALRNGHRWNDMALGLPDYVHGYGRWMPPPYRRRWSVFAALPMDKKEPMDLAAKPEEVAAVEYDIEKQMKDAKYAEVPEFKEQKARSVIKHGPAHAIGEKYSSPTRMYDIEKQMKDAKYAEVPEFEDQKARPAINHGPAHARRAVVKLKSEESKDFDEGPMSSEW